MHELVLHHYAESPFSEKIRTILGHKGLSWRSSTIPAIMPKPDLVALTGGYRRTPVLQVGADVYCDTALIADVLERRAKTPTLYPPRAAGLAATVAQWADTTLFWAVVGYVFQPIGLDVLFSELPPERREAFLKDRAAFRGSAPRMAAVDAEAALRVYLPRLEAQLTASSWLLGDEASLADFSVYHCLWYVQRVPPLARVLEPFAAVRRWLHGMAAKGHGTSAPISSAEAVALAASSTPEPTDGPFLDQHGIPQGTRVTIAATDYGTDPVEGDLVVSRENELAVRRVDPRAGEVVVHVPRVGFRVQRVTPK